jgi:hypothetical protein
VQFAFPSFIPEFSPMTVSHASVWRSFRFWTHQRFQSIQYGFIIGLHLFIVIYLAIVLNIGVDDAYSLDTTSKDFAYTLHQAIHFEIQAPLYFIFLYFWRLVSSSIFFARLFSVLCILLSLYAVGLITKRYLNRVPPVWVVAVVALHPYTIWAATLIRVYALAILLSVLLMLFFYDGYLSNQPQNRARWFYAVTAVAACYTHYFLCFFFVAQGLTLLVLRRRGFWIYSLTLLAVAACFTPMLVYLPRQIHKVEGDTPLPQLKDLIFLSRYTLSGILNYALPTGDPVTRLPWAKLLRLAGLLVGLGLMLRYRRRLSSSPTSLALVILVLSMAPVLVGLVWWADAITLISPRYFYPLFIPVLLLSFALVGLTQSHQAIRLWFCVLLFLSATALAITYAPLSTEGDWKRVAHYVMQHEQPQQPVLVFSGESLLPLAHYYRGPNPLVPIPRPMSLKVYNMDSQILQSQDEIEAALASLPETQAIWLVQELDYRTAGPATGCQPDNSRFNCQILETFLQEHYRVEQSQLFHRSLVRFLKRKPETVSSGQPVLR